MKFDPLVPPRQFEVGLGKIVTMQDCAHIHLQPDEQVTFFTESGAEYDVARKEWGYYATPSLNGRLVRFGLRPALVKNRYDQFFIMLVEKDKVDKFEAYLEEEGQIFVTWMDSTEQLLKF